MSVRGYPVTSSHGYTNALGARRFVENARRERGHRDGRLCQIGVREVVENGKLQRAGQRRGMARSARAAFVHRIGFSTRRLGGAVLWGWLCSLRTLVVMVAVPIRVRVLGMIVRAGRPERHFCHVADVSGSAKDHGCRRVPLEGHGKHHDPKNEQANPVHAKNSSWSGDVTGAVRISSPRRMLRAVQRRGRGLWWSGLPEAARRAATPHPNWAASARLPVRPPLRRANWRLRPLAFSSIPSALGSCARKSRRPSRGRATRARGVRNLHAVKLTANVGSSRSSCGKTSMARLEMLSRLYSALLGV